MFTEKKKSPTDLKSNNLMYQGCIKIKILYLPVNIQDEEPETKSTESIG